MRPFRALVLLAAGAVGGLAVAAGVLKRALPSRGSEESDEVALVAIRDGVKLRSRAQAFRGGTVFAWFGGVELDLREATLAPDARLTIHALFGGVAVRVPPEWRVESGLTAILGGVDTRRRGQAEEAPPTLVVDGLAVLGGIAVGGRAESAAEAASPSAAGEGRGGSGA